MVVGSDYQNVDMLIQPRRSVEMLQNVLYIDVGTCSINTLCKEAHSLVIVEDRVVLSVRAYLQQVI